jgi:hypothetical protein
MTIFTHISDTLVERLLDSHACSHESLTANVEPWDFGSPADT